MAGRSQVLIASSDPEGRQALMSVLAQCGLEPVFSSTVREARAILAREAIRLVFCEACLADGNFRDLLGAAELTRARVPVVVASRLDDTTQYLEAMRSGAFDFIARPYRRAEVEWIISNALRKVAAAAA